jgi:hypothetical protein
MFQPGGDHKDIEKTITRLREKAWSAIVEWIQLELGLEK